MIEMTIKGCWFCEGTGYYWGQKCGACDGSGQERIRKLLQRVYNIKQGLPLRYNQVIDKKKL